MKKISTKKKVLYSALSVFALALMADNSSIFGLCEYVGTGSIKHCRDIEIMPEFMLQIFGFLSLYFIVFSLITYRMQDGVFTAWWNFARWWVPVIVVVTFLLNTMSSGGGGLGMDDMLNSHIYAILYGVLIVVSSVKIYRAWARVED